MHCLKWLISTQWNLLEARFKLKESTGIGTPFVLVHIEILTGPFFPFYTLNKLLCFSLHSFHSFFRSHSRKVSSFLVLFSYALTKLIGNNYFVVYTNYFIRVIHIKTNEWTNKRTNQRTSKRMNEWTSVCTYVRMNETVT